MSYEPPMATDKAERRELLEWMSSRRLLDVHTVIKVSPTLWTISYERGGVRYRLSLDTMPESNPLDNW